MKLWGPYSALGMSIALLFGLVDQIQKYWTIFIYQISEKGPIAVTSFLDITFVWNRGISYGLFAQYTDTGRWLLIGASSLVTFILWVWLARAHNRLAAISLGLIIGGAVGNIMDRIVYGAVADFFSFHIGTFYWYVFNLADVWIVCGVLGLLFETLRESRNPASIDE